MLSTPGYLSDNFIPVGVNGPQSVPFTFTIPAGRCRFIYLQSIYTSDATPGLRAPFLEIFDDNSNSQLRIGQGVQNPSQTFRYTWMQGSGFSAGFGVIAHKYLPQGLMVFENWQLVIDSVTKGPADSQIIALQMDQVT